MFYKTLRLVAAIISLASLVTLGIIGAYYSSEKSLRLPSEAEINALSNVGSGLTASERQAVIRSRQSAVQVISLDLTDGGISVSSGTYLKYEGHYFILTTSHGVGGQCSLTQIAVDDKLYNCVQYLLRDSQTDYIIMEISSIRERTPVEIPSQSPRRRHWREAMATQATIFYTGFPNQGGPYTFDGRIVGYREDEALFVDSYGWSGSSGSGVFSGRGKLIGYILALEVGETYFGREVLENFIWVVPLFKVDWPAAAAFAD